MPELPEVETVVRGLRDPLIGRTVEGMWTDWAPALTPPPDHFAARIAGQTFRGISRRAKYILCELDDDILVIHLRMTGRLYVTPDAMVHDADRWVHFRLQLDGGRQLRFSDVRKFGTVMLTSDLSALERKLGPEPLADDFTATVMAGRMAGRKRAIKALLLDQGFIAGVGNIYADEALYRAGIHPLQRADRLTEAQAHALAVLIWGVC